MAEPNDPVARQVDAYNALDLDAFAGCYAQDLVVEDAAGGVVMRGLEAFRHAYGQLFRASPDLHVEIASRMRIGEYVIDEELVTGRHGSDETLHVAVVYHVANGVIDHVRVIR